MTKAIESVLKQEYKNIELIVVDDGSTDHTGAVLDLFPTISVIRQENKGQGAARQAGLKSSKGRYVASLDSDDFWKPHFISQSLSALRRTRAAFSFANWSTQSAEGNCIQEDSLEGFSYLEFEQNNESHAWASLDQKSTREVFTRHSPAPSSSLLVDREFIKHGWRSSFRISDDWAFLLDIILSRPDATCVFSIDRLWTKQIDGSNICDRHTDSVAASKNKIHDLRALLAIHEKCLSEEEIEAFDTSIHSSVFDLVYAQSVTEGHRRAAIRTGFEYFCNSPTKSTVVPLFKSLARSWFGFRR